MIDGASPLSTIQHSAVVPRDGSANSFGDPRKLTTATEQLDAVCDRYESDWKRKGPQILSKLMRSLSPISTELFWELILIDLEYRWRRSSDLPITPLCPNHPTVDDYLQWLSNESIERSDSWLPLCEMEVPATVLETEIRLRQHAGHCLRIDEFRQRYPTLSRARMSEIADQIQRHAVADSKNVFDFLKHSTLTCNLFASRLLISGVVSRSRLQVVWKTLPTESRTLFGLAQALGSRGKLTPFQARCIIVDDGSPLVIGPYILRDKIGAGGMAQVYLAMHQNMKRLVAIKLIAKELVLEKDVTKRFIREIVAAGRLNHPHIVRAYDAGVYRDVHYMVMEYVDGADLNTRVRESGPLDLIDALNVIQQAAQGLAHAHDRGIVHRDIKPSNLLIDESQVVKVVDFGLAQLTLECDGSFTQGLTQTGSTLGTLDYIAPEQAKDATLADPRSDIYSLGCTLYFLLTGKPLYGGSTIQKRLIAHRNAPIPKLGAKWGNEVRLNFDLLLERMVAKRPCDRFANMHEATVAIGNLLKVLSPTTIDHPSTSSETNVPAVKNPTVTIAHPIDGAAWTRFAITCCRRMHFFWLDIALAILAAVTLTSALRIGWMS